MWLLSFNSYIYNFLFYLAIYRLEGSKKSGLKVKQIDPL